MHSYCRCQRSSEDHRVGNHVARSTEQLFGSRVNDRLILHNHFLIIIVNSYFSLYRPVTYVSHIHIHINSLYNESKYICTSLTIKTCICFSKSFWNISSDFLYIHAVYHFKAPANIDWTAIVGNTRERNLMVLRWIKRCCVIFVDDIPSSPGSDTGFENLSASN